MVTMANRYRKRQSRSRTPEPTSAQNPAWMPSSPRMPRSRLAHRSIGGWGSMGNLDQIMNSLQESIQQKQKECCSSFESLDNLSDEDDDSGIRMTDDPLSSSKWRNSDALFGAKNKPDLRNGSGLEDTPVLPHRKPRSVQGSRENLTDLDPDFRTARRMLPTVNPAENQLNFANALLRTDFDRRKGGFPRDDPESNSESGSPARGVIGASLGYKINTIDDNWIMKPAVKDPHQTSLDEEGFTSVDQPQSPGQTDTNDVNNNQGADRSPRFTKNTKSVVPRRSEVNTRRRSRWDCTSPVTIKLQHSKTEVLPSKSTQPDNCDMNKPLPAYRRSQSEDCLKSPSNRTFKSPQRIAKPSPAVVPNPKFRQGFNLNAQRKLSSQRESAVSKPTDPAQKSKWEQTHVGPSILFDNAEEVRPDACGDSEDNRGGTMLYISAKDNDGGADDEMVDTEVKESSVPDEASPNKSYEAFFVSCTDEGSSERQAASEMTDDERAIKFPQWVIPFIDDNLTGRFECGSGKMTATKSKISPSADKKATSPASSGPRRSKSPSVSKLQKDSSPVPPPRMKRTAAMNRILQEKDDDLACRERPLPEKPERSKTPTIRVPERVKSPVRTPHRLPRVPSESSSISNDGSEPESFPVHYVQHTKGPTVPLTKGASLRTSCAQKPDAVKQALSEKGLGQKSRAASRPDLSKAGVALAKPTTPRSALNSKRCKSMDNLAFLSSSAEARNKKDIPARSTPTRRCLPGDNAAAKKSEPDNNKSGRRTPVQGENRAMRALREAMTNKGASSSSPHQMAHRQPTASTARRETLTPTSSAESTTASRNRRPTPAEKPNNLRSRSRTRFERQSSTDSEESFTSRRSDKRVKVRTPVRRSVSLKEGSCVRISDENDCVEGETLTLPRRRSRVEKASVHAGGYGTLRTVASTSDMPKSILKKRLPVTVSKPGPDITTESGENEPTTRSGKRVLPPPPDDVDVDFDEKLSVQSWMSTSVDNLNLSRSSSRDDLLKPSAAARSRKSSTTSSSDGSILGLRRTAFTSSRESLFKRSNSREDVLASPTTSKPSQKVNTPADRSRSPRKSSLTSSRESLARGSETKGTPATAANKNKTRQRSLSASRENLLKKSASRETLTSNASPRRIPDAKVSSPRDHCPKPGVPPRSRISSARSETSLHNTTAVTSGGQSARLLALQKSGLQPVDSIKKHKKTLHGAGAGGKDSNHKMSDRFRKLVEGDITELATPAPSVGKNGGGLSERESSFDSGVEFVMHL